MDTGSGVNALTIVFASLCIFAIAYRFYGLFIASKVLRLDEARQTPAVKYADGQDYVPTNKYVLFGHHFAAIAAAGPLLGPVLAAQFGYARAPLDPDWLRARRRCARYGRALLLGASPRSFFGLHCNTRN